MNPSPSHFSQPSLALMHFSLSSQGDRSENEDAYGHVRDGELIAFAVADGMGGAKGGRRASALALTTLRNTSLTMEANAFEDQLLAMSDAIKLEQLREPELAKMCTTVAELRIDTYSQKAIWAHWGDSRVYWFRGGELMAMTEDHSVVQSLVSAGLLTEEEATNYPQRNVLLGAAGANSEVGPSVHEQVEPLAKGDAFLLCTDGLWSVIGLQLIQEHLALATTVQDWIQALMDEVSRMGGSGKDNFTATGVWITSEAERTLAPL